MKIVKLVFLLTAFSITFANAKVQKEDELIMKAIFYTQYKQSKEAAVVWKKLFDATNNQKYLVEYFYASLTYRDIKDIIKEIKSSLNKKKSKELYELLAALYTKEGDTDGVLEAVENLNSNNSESMYELAYLYTIKGKHNKALSLYKKIYEQDKSWSALKGIISILAQNGKIKEASNMLWSAIKDSKSKMPKDTYIVYTGLIDYKKETKKAIFAFKKLYKLTNDKKYVKQLISLYPYEKDYNSIIDILEKTHYDNKLLYELYLSKQDSISAYKLLYYLYKDSKDPKWLAEKAILTYEIANGFEAVDSRVVDSVSSLFDRAIELVGQDATYYNYYGYTLIDYSKEIPKGIKLVKEALKLEPNNIFYLDSLAWGYYKTKRCNDAKNIVKKIKKLAKEPLEDDIIKHIKKINSCKEK